MIVYGRRHRLLYHGAVRYLRRRDKMNFHSLKTRFIGSYLILLALFIIQVPIIYFLVGGMGEKYAQVDESGALRKRAVEMTEVLNRHIMSGDERLEKVFQANKREYSENIGSLRSGTAEVVAITDPAVLAKLDTLEQKWNSMRASLDKGMENGDALRESKIFIEATTGPMVERLDALAAVLGAGHSNLVGLQKMRTVRLSYLYERYITSFDDRDALRADIKRTVDEFDASLAGLKAVVKGGRAAGPFAGVEAAWLDRKDKIVSGVEASDAYQAIIATLVDVNTPEIVSVAAEVTHLLASNAKADARRAIVIMAVSVFASAVLAVLFMVLANTQLLRPLTKVKETVEAFARGDLTRRASIRIRFLGRDLDDEVTGLASSVDEMASQMSGVIGRITDSSSLLASASEQLSASSTQIADGANRQSSQTLQVATAMEEMNATVIEVARNSQQASESARDAQNTAAKGGDVVTQAITAMQEVADSTSVTADTIKNLGKSSEEIGSIVSVINDIADQTNLLALNAAIEAARAGEQGRGFAVVADEVRRLAERTTKATKEISDMIKSIQNETGRAVEAMGEGTFKVENGVKLANEAGEALKQIVRGVESVTNMINHIATSAEEQSATTDEITQNMDSIAEVAKSNVSAIGEVANASGEMARLATELRGLVANFTIASAGGPGEGPKAAVINPSRGPKLHVIATTTAPEAGPRFAAN